MDQIVCEGFTLSLDDDEDWPDPDDPRWYDDHDEDGREALTAAERNPSLCRR